MRPSRVLALLLVLLPVVAKAQYVVKKVVFLGAAPYEDAELQTIAALPAGTHISPAEMKAASQRLVDTGYFDSVENTLDGPFKAVEVRFKVKPVDQSKLMRAGFENIVWFTPQELSTALAAKLPLYAHGIPEVGTQQGLIQSAVTELLAAKGVAATLSYGIVEPSQGRLERVVEYRAESPEVLLHAAHISGVTTGMAPTVRASLGQTTGTHYNEGLAGFTTAERLLSPYFEAGYVEAHLENVSRAVLPGEDTRRVQMDLTAKIVAGEPYHVSSIQLAETPLMTSDDFAKTLKLHPGDLATHKDVRAMLVPLALAYHAKGYMNAGIDAVPTTNPATHEVAYTVTVIPGAIYTVHTIAAKGLPADAEAQFYKIIGFAAGDAYNDGLVQRFFRDHIGKPPFNSYSAGYEAIADPETHLVDLTVTFKKS